MEHNDNDVVAVEGYGFPRKGNQAIAALLQEGSVSAAARAVKVTEKTIYNWLKREDFSTAYREARVSVLEHAVSRLQSISSKAVRTLEEALECDNPAIKVRSALGILDHCSRFMELDDLASRIEQLESQSSETVVTGYN